ncbi:hypothetical protein WH47_12106 [Habropoda laboriosa]|uniref:Uncharacterized protein n=1 Tax=Habropoda laboriosa TaxID=597456 RepID=A0A0L7R1C5_9HYME|nr:PREDICTED: uncharacterized protein LOC108573031 [Habropoda laboriosa]KOC64642.1 hypothetical protein WH47_12106 [Habropoda laboriosa]
MKENVNVEGTSDEDKIRTVLDMLKKQINLYTVTNENLQSKAELTRSQRIQKLMMEERRLSAQFQQIRKEIKRYEKKYEKALKKKVKLMEVQIKEGQSKLTVMRQKYHELDTQVNMVSPEKITDANKEERKKKIKPIKRKTLNTKFKQKNMTISKKIRIRIKGNANLDKRKMLSVNDDKRQCTLTNLVNIVKPVTENTRECKVMLQRLSREQMNRYVIQKRLQQQQVRAKRKSRSSLKIQKKMTSIRKPSWHIKIPKSVFEESQEGNQSPELNVAPSLKDVARLN